MRPLSLLSVLLIPFLSFSQEAKVNIESLNIFSDSKEKAIFANIQNKDSGDYFHLLLLSDNYSSKKTDRSQCAVRINDFIASQENASNQQLSSKDIKKLYKLSMTPSWLNTKPILGFPRFL